MNERERQFLMLYQEHRYDDQRRYYEARAAEFETARTQAINLHTLLMILAAIAAALAALNTLDIRVVWSVLAAVFPLLATAVSAYEGLYAFERQAKLFADVVNAMRLIQAAAPVPNDVVAVVDPTAVSVYVEQVEAVLRREQSQWGQLISEVQLAARQSSTK